MQITTIGLDIAKNVFQVHGIDANEKVVVRKQLRRSRVIAFLKALPTPLSKAELPLCSCEISVVPHFEFSDWRGLLEPKQWESIPPTAPAPATPHESLGPQYSGTIQEARKFRRRPASAPMIALVISSDIHLLTVPVWPALAGFELCSFFCKSKKRTTAKMARAKDRSRWDIFELCTPKSVAAKTDREYDLGQAQPSREAVTWREPISYLPTSRASSICCASSAAAADARAVTTSPG
jgi:hypothetical protein